MSARLVAVSLSAISIAVPAIAQSAGNASAASAFDSRGWSTETQVIRSGTSELLGGPVRQPGEIRLANDTGPDYYYDHKPASAGVYARVPADRSETDISRDADIRPAAIKPATASGISEQDDYVRPGTQVQTISGTPLGRIALVGRAQSDGVRSVWVQPPNSNSAQMLQVNIRSVTYSGGEFIAVAG
ncbi:hypothetical protein WNY37_08835 [Henriciella sp. AS95]|uniref:hypothetical protein n=1 Tax=Henriciella sp. AS95 TaxID=3135782 RepID=UPI003179A69C